MNTELITIGDEILIGQIVDTNSAWMAQKLHEIGFKVSQITSISDDENHIVNALRQSTSDLIIITGGLGPTNDDITKHTLSKYFETKLVFNESVFQHIQSLLVGRGVIVNALNKEQAMLPEQAIILENKCGTAAGMWFEKDKKIVVSLPGVPYEMKGLMENEVLPRLKNIFNPKVILHKTILTVGLPESMLAMSIKDWEANLPIGIKLAYLPRPGIVRLRLTAQGDDKKKLENQVKEEINKLEGIIPDQIYGFDNDSLEEVIGHLLIKTNSTLSTAESCTGGAISALITSVSGCSKYYKGSIISYSNEIKNEHLNVSNDLLLNKGAVSSEVVEKMATSVRSKFNTNYAISVSGIAGPEGGTESKPVGTTWIAICDDNKVVSQVFNLGEDRGRNITRASLLALNMLRLFILNKI